MDGLDIAIAEILKEYFIKKGYSETFVEKYIITDERFLILIKILKEYYLIDYQIKDKKGDIDMDGKSAADRDVDMLKKELLRELIESLMPAEKPAETDFYELIRIADGSISKLSSSNKKLETASEKLEMYIKKNIKTARG
ncbi:MAG: hypothetical protein FWE04_03755 [Oscillospiraceae bacterium]|nr:hypothetical protein [Oscillospiraceae bacterium]